MSKKKAKVEPVDNPDTFAEVVADVAQGAVESAIRKEVAPVIEVVSTMRRALALMARARRRRRSA